MKFSVVTEVSVILIITQISSSLKKLHILIFSKCKYLHAKIATFDGKCLALYGVHGIPLRLSTVIF